ncbi:hypothetical protein CFT13S00388_09125 [Campylobacter fetus subsp. testudinum]|uniref:hypothetical protein n=1 Tax=Campylobacter fetus TaxID=196 RepID=UPI000818B018|nr:hypothetical protein [Campylobacter fetus]OCR86439.1 hypothetical protein CFT13S00388_09125 [Campylobacter fetus subsp. testudinum]
MISAGEHKELGFLMCIFGIINTEKESNGNKDIKVLKNYQDAISRLINGYTKEEQEKAKTKAKKFLNAIVNRADKKEDFIIELRYLVCFLSMIKFEPNERKTPLNDNIKVFWGRWRVKILEYMYSIFDTSLERHIIHTEEYGYKILGDFK